MTSATGVASLDPRDVKRLREIVADLGRLRLDDPSCLPTLVPALRELLDTDVMVAYGLLESVDERQELDFVHAAGQQSNFVPAFTEFIARQPVSWAAYNPGRPEPAQRNKLLSMSWKAMAEERRVPVVIELFPKIGFGGKTQTRMLVCERDSLLAWVGSFQSGACNRRQRQIFKFLLCPLQQRLSVERKLNAACSKKLYLDAALDAIGRAAFVVDARGRIAEANGMAKTLLVADRRGVLAELHDSVKGLPTPRWAPTRIVLDAGAHAFLVVERIEQTGRLASQLVRGQARWRLTPRQLEILAELAAGHANRTIAAILGISERTVEIHVTALLDATGAESRSHLIAKLYTLE